MTANAESPFLVALNLTRRCNLACVHCYLDAGTRDAGGPTELSVEELTVLIGHIAALGGDTMLVLTGGEPLLRPDLDTIARRASDLGLMVVVGTNGTLLDGPRVAALRAAGVHAVGISLDSLDPAHHDRFRGRPGAWQAATSGIDACRRGGLMFQVHFTATDDNADELDGVIEFARSAGAAVLNVFFVVCTGRGRSLSNISVATYEKVLGRLAMAAREEENLIVRARCAPHFKRLAREMRPPLPITLADGYEAGGCLAGTRYCRVTPEGDVTPCPYMEVSAGSVRDKDLAELWREAPLFAALRSPRLEGRCGTCEYTKLCGGCRARPLARDGNLMGEDFLCGYQPADGAMIDVATMGPASLTWASDAEARLAHVPAAVRRFVRKRVESHVRECGESVVRAAHLDALARRRFAGAAPTRPARAQ
ncbi:MAG: radical SAM protein [Hyphomicrobiaceae bacterium]